MFLDLLPIELHCYFDRAHVNNKKEEFDRLNNKIILLKINIDLYILPPLVFESAIVYLSMKNDTNLEENQVLLCMLL
jgi:hypothetical protein